MASVKVKFRPSTVEGREGTIYFQVTHARKVSLFFTKYYIFPSEWSYEVSMVLVPENSMRSKPLSIIEQHIRRDVEQLNKIVRKLEGRGLEFTTNQIIEEFNRCQKEVSLTNFMQSIIDEKNARKRIRTAEAYEASLRRFKVFLFENQNNDDIFLYQITPRLIESYETWQFNRGIKPNTSSFYMRILRATYNRAVDCGFIEDLQPFRHVYKGVSKTEKRAVPIAMLRKIKQMNFSEEPSLGYARDMYVLSLMLRGMSIVDMSFLKKKDLVDGYIIYKRRKTGQRMVIEWLPEMQAILDKYPENPTEYLLPIITKNNINTIHTYRNKGAKINRDLKKIAGMIGLNMNLTLYTARHSWASLAKAQGVSISIISAGMGHDSEKTTEIYLSELDSSLIDTANRGIISIL